jgi:hypothetical protein
LEEVEEEEQNSFDSSLHTDSPSWFFADPQPPAMVGATSDGGGRRDGK